jgi:hypothetical protein
VSDQLEGVVAGDRRTEEAAAAADCMTVVVVADCRTVGAEADYRTVVVVAVRRTVVAAEAEAGWRGAVVVLPPGAVAEWEAVGARFRAAAASRHRVAAEFPGPLFSIPSWKGGGKHGDYWPISKSLHAA